MLKVILFVSAIFGALIVMPAVAGEYDRGDRVEHRFDQRGDRIEERLDARGDSIEERLDAKGDRIGAYYERAEYGLPCQPIRPLCVNACIRPF